MSSKRQISSQHGFTELSIIKYVSNIIQFMTTHPNMPNFLSNETAFVGEPRVGAPS